MSRCARLYISIKFKLSGLVWFYFAKVIFSNMILPESETVTNLRFDIQILAYDMKKQSLKWALNIPHNQWW